MTMLLKLLSARGNRRHFAKSVWSSGVAMMASGLLFSRFSSTAHADEQGFDVIVAGSGAAGMTAALTAAKRGLKVLVIDAASCFGGSTARSGGGIWIRNNPINQSAASRTRSLKPPST